MDSATVAILAALTLSLTALASVVVYASRLARSERFLDAMRKRFEEAGIDVEATQPLETGVVVPEGWQDELEDDQNGQPRELPDEWVQDRLTSR